MNINEIMKKAAKAATANGNKAADGGKYTAYKNGRTAMVEAVKALVGSDFQVLDGKGDDNVAHKDIEIRHVSGVRFSIGYDVQLTRTAGGWNSRYAFNAIKAKATDDGERTLDEMVAYIKQRDYAENVRKAEALDGYKKELREAAEAILAAIESESEVNIRMMDYGRGLHRTANYYNASIIAKKQLEGGTL